MRWITINQILYILIPSTNGLSLKATFHEPCFCETKWVTTGTYWEGLLAVANSLPGVSATRSRIHAVLVLKAVKNESIIAGSAIVLYIYIRHYNIDIK